MSLRQDSNASIGFPDIQSESKEINSKNTVESSSPEVRDQLTDVCGILLICRKHNNIVVSKITTKGLWLPLIVLKPNDSYFTAAFSLIGMVFDPNVVTDTSDPQLINIFRVKLPKVNNFITRITFMSTLSTALESECCKPYKRYEWMPIENALESDEFWGPEIRHFIKTYTESDTSHAVQEFDVNDALKYIPRETPLNSEELMLKMTRSSENDIKKLYEEFVIHCFPSQFMTLSSFTSFANRIEFKMENIEQTFHSFDLHNNRFITFHEMLIGLTVMDPGTQHGGTCFPIRCGYIFRYYDSDSDGWLTHPDICALMRDAKVGYSENSVTELIERIGSNSRVNSDQFFRAVEDMQLKGTSHLFRTKISVLRDIAHKFSYERNCANNAYGVALVKNRKYQKACGQCRKRKYRLSVQVIKLLRPSHETIIVNIESDLKRLNINQYVWDIPMNPLNALARDLIAKINTIGMILFDSHSTQYQTPRAMQSFNNWFYESKQELLKNLRIICLNAMNIFAKEDRVVRITSPCYVFGDIHGNLNDLLTYSQNLWKSSPFVNESNFLFLGDYVDRGRYGVECVIYLFALKILAPKAFYLVRGNHEVRQIQENFTFYRECVDRFDEDLWNQINNAFDRLCICAVIDDCIYCAHGGIPTTTHTIEALMNIPQPLPDPQNQSPQAWEVLWNDPLSAEDFMSLSNFQRAEIDKTRGFVENIKRGTGYCYSEQAVENFLLQNHLSGVIRAHEVVFSGYRFMANGKLISIFSSSLYCGLRNTAAVVLLDREKIRIIRIETFY